MTRVSGDRIKPAGRDVLSRAQRDYPVVNVTLPGGPGDYPFHEEEKSCRR
jgi:hypothetical protein